MVGRMEMSVARIALSGKQSAISILTTRGVKTLSWYRIGLLSVVLWIMVIYQSLHIIEP